METMRCCQSGGETGVVNLFSRLALIGFRYRFADIISERHPVKAPLADAFHERSPRTYVLTAKVAQARLGYVAVQTEAPANVVRKRWFHGLEARRVNSLNAAETAFKFSIDEGSFGAKIGAVS